MSKILGIVNALGESDDAQFTSEEINDGSSGSYRVTYNTPFSKTPVTLVSLVNSAQGMGYRITPHSEGFEIYVTQDLGNGPAPAKASFNFSAWSDSKG